MNHPRILIGAILIAAIGMGPAAVARDAAPSVGVITPP